MKDLRLLGQSIIHIFYAQKFYVCNSWLGCKELLTESMTMVLVMCKSKHGFEVSINFLVSEFWYIDMLKLSFKRKFWWIAKNLNKNIRRTERISFCTIVLCVKKQKNQWVGHFTTLYGPFWPTTLVAFTKLSFRPSFWCA